MMSLMSPLLFFKHRKRSYLFYHRARDVNGLQLAIHLNHCPFVHVYVFIIIGVQIYEYHVAERRSSVCLECFFTKFFADITFTVLVKHTFHSFHELVKAVALEDAE